MLHTIVLALQNVFPRPHELHVKLRDVVTSEKPPKETLHINWHALVKSYRDGANVPAFVICLWLVTLMKNRLVREEEHSAEVMKGVNIQRQDIWVRILYKLRRYKQTPKRLGSSKLPALAADSIRITQRLKVMLVQSRHWEKTEEKV